MMRGFVPIGINVVCLISLANGVGLHRYLAADQPNETAKEIKNSIGMTLIRIPAGAFLMGSSAEEKHRGSDETQHEVSITKPFYLGAFEVTQGQYVKIMGNNPSHFSANGGGKQQVQDRDTSDYPVERVAWLDAVEFCKKLSAKEKKTHRLPSEAEWEYACPAGTKTVFHPGNDFHSYLANINGLGYSSYGKETSGPFYRSTVKVGEDKRNDFCLFYIHG